MSFRKLEYTVLPNYITPSVCRYGGVQGEDGATSVVFDVSALDIGAGDLIRVEATNGTGGFYSSEHLALQNGKVEFIIPYEVTYCGGTAVLQLIITTDNSSGSVVKYSLPIKISFYPSADGTQEHCEYKDTLSGLAKEAESYAEKAKSVTESAVNAHNADVSAHSDIRGKITSDISAHNNDGDAHPDIWEAICYHENSNSAHNIKESLKNERQNSCNAIRQTVTGNTLDQTVPAFNITDLNPRAASIEVMIKQYWLDLQGKLYVCGINLMKNSAAVTSGGNGIAFETLSDGRIKATGNVVSASDSATYVLHNLNTAALDYLPTGWYTLRAIGLKHGSVTFGEDTGSSMTSYTVTPSSSSANVYHTKGNDFAVSWKISGVSAGTAINETVGVVLEYGKDSGILKYSYEPYKEICIKNITENDSDDRYCECIACGTNKVFVTLDHGYPSSTQPEWAVYIYYNQDINARLAKIESLIAALSTN